MAINIKPSKRGTFTAAATKRGKTVQGFASQVMANKENYSPAMVKKANFARNAANWKKELGGFLDQELNTPIIEETPVDSGMTPVNAFQDGGKLSEKYEDLKYLKYAEGEPLTGGLFGNIAQGVGGTVGLLGAAGAFKGKDSSVGLSSGQVAQTQAGQQIEALGRQQLGNTMPQIQPLPTPSPGKYQDGGILPSEYGYGLLPEYGFGSWLGDNAGGILKGVGGIVSVIPGFGQIAGPALIGAGAATDAIVGKVRGKRAGEQLETAEEREAAQAERKAESEERIGRLAEQFDPSKNIAYGATFQFGGDLMQGGQGSPQNPVITGYDGNSNSHQQGIGGVPVDSRGNPSTVSKQSAIGMTEKGEVTWNGYVFSDKLKV